MSKDDVLGAFLQNGTMVGPFLPACSNIKGLIGGALRVR